MVDALVTFYIAKLSVTIHTSRASKDPALMGLA